MPLRDPTTKVDSSLCPSLQVPSPSFLPLFSLRPIERSTKRAINRLTSSRACPEYCPSMGPTCARVERSSFFSLYFGAVFLPPSPLFSAHPLCNIRSTKGKNKKNGNGNLSWAHFHFRLRAAFPGSNCKCLQRGGGGGGGEEDCEITRWRLL